MVHDPLDPSILEAKVVECPSKEPPTHPNVSPLHVKLDGHNSCGWGMLKIIHELLDEEDIISDAMSTDKSPLIRVDKMRHDHLKLPDQNSSIYLIEGGAQANRSKVT